MASKRIQDVSGEYPQDAARPASDAQVASIKRAATPLRTGRLERDVDAVLVAKGFRLDEAIGGARKKKAGRRLR